MTDERRKNIEGKLETATNLVASTEYPPLWAVLYAEDVKDLLAELKQCSNPG